MSISKKNKQAKKHDYPKSVSRPLLLIITVLGIFTISNANESTLNISWPVNASGTHIQILLGIFMLFIGIGIPLIIKTKSNPSFGDRVLRIVVLMQLGLLGAAILWELLAYNSIALVLSAFILFLEVPLVPVVILLSLLGYKKLFRWQYSWYITIAIVLNWLSLIFIVYNVTD